MLPRVAALLSSLIAGTIGSAEILSRVRFAVDGNAVVAAGAGIAAKFPRAVSGSVHSAASEVVRAITLSLHIALAPTAVVVSLLMTGCRVAATTVGDLAALALFWLQHWM